MAAPFRADAAVPETDDAAWFTIEVAQVKIVSGQRPILEAVSRVIDL